MIIVHSHSALIGCFITKAFTLCVLVLFYKARTAMHSVPAVSYIVYSALLRAHPILRLQNVRTINVAVLYYYLTSLASSEMTVFNQT